MATLIYSTIASFDGFVEDCDGGFEWVAPDEEVFAVINQLERSVGTYLLGRRMYETMVCRETAANRPDQSDVERDCADIWMAAQKWTLSKVTEVGVSSAMSAPDAALRGCRTVKDRRLVLGALL